MLNMVSRRNKLLIVGLMALLTAFTVLAAAFFEITILYLIVLFCTYINVVLLIGISSKINKVSSDIQREISGSLKNDLGKLRVDINRKEQATYLAQLYAVLNPIKPFPVLGDSAISPDLAYQYVDYILKHKPKKILECGSGVSTLLTALALKKAGGGELISLENDKKYLEITEKLLKEHGVNKYVKLKLAPLKRVETMGYDLLWYSIKEIDKLKNIDMVFVDGPPGFIQELSRLPALPILYSALSKGYVILLDDTNRKDEQLIIDIWKNKYRLDEQKLEAEKGAVILWGQK